MTIQTRKGDEKGLGEADHVHGHRDGLGQEEKDADGAAELHAQAAADQVVGAAAFDPRVGGDGGQGKCRQAGDHLGAQNDQNHLQDAGLAHDLAEPQKHDHAQNGERAGGEHTAEGSEFGPWRCIVLAGWVFIFAHTQPFPGTGCRTRSDSNAAIAVAPLIKSSITFFTHADVPMGNIRVDLKDHSAARKHAHIAISG